MNAIETIGLRKTFGGVEAVKSLSLAIAPGEMFGLVGPDGAGKTTTIRILCGLTGADTGSAAVLGYDVATQKREAQNSLGYLSQRFSLYGDLTVDENIEFFADIHKVRDWKPRRDHLLEMMRLSKFRDRPADKLSGGMKQKLALACSLIHTPKVLILDEPTTGVDPVSRRDFWKIISSLSAEGITILLTTPYLDEAEKCNRIGLMHEGEIIALGTAHEVMNSIGMSVLEIFTPAVRESVKVIREGLPLEPQAFGDRLDVLTPDPGKTLGEVTSLLAAKGIPVTEHKFKTPSLENIFIHLVKSKTA